MLAGALIMVMGAAPGVVAATKLGRSRGAARDHLKGRQGGHTVLDSARPKVESSAMTSTFMSSLLACAMAAAFALAVAAPACAQSRDVDENFDEGRFSDLEGGNDRASRRPARRQRGVAGYGGGGSSGPSWAVRLRPFRDGRSLLHGYSATGGLTMMTGESDLAGWRVSHAARPTAMGYRYYERNGFITGTIVAIMRIMSAAMVSAGPKSYRTWDEGNYRYTETTYYSPAEKRAMQDAASNDAARAFARQGQSFDLEVFSRDLGGDSSGYKLQMMLGGAKLNDGAGMLDFGFGFGDVKSAVADGTQYLITQWNYLGMPIRYSYAVGPAIVYGLFEWNWYGHSRDADLKKHDGSSGTVVLHTAGFPLRLGVATALFGRLYVDAAINTPSLTSGKFGYALSAGARF